MKKEIIINKPFIEDLMESSYKNELEKKVKRETKRNRCGWIISVSLYSILLFGFWECFFREENLEFIVLGLTAIFSSIFIWLIVILMFNDKVSDNEKKLREYNKIAELKQYLCDPKHNFTKIYIDGLNRLCIEGYTTMICAIITIFTKYQTR